MIRGDKDQPRKKDWTEFVFVCKLRCCCPDVRQQEITTSGVMWGLSAEK